MEITAANKALAEAIAYEIELPESAYIKARERYEDLGNWFSRDLSSIRKFSPHVHSQGSFRLGTAIRPIDQAEEYDLDLNCRLDHGVSSSTHTQAELRSLIRAELSSYRKARNIADDIEEKNRCLRLSYRDSLAFHMDIVPSIPASLPRISQNLILLESKQVDRSLAGSISNNVLFITDQREPNFDQISDEWPVSNPEGFAIWFESRVQLGIKSGEWSGIRAGVEPLPLFKKRSPLQQVIQILKRHRDYQFRKAPHLKPVSIIITTLAASAYSGEADVLSALKSIVFGMGNHINHQSPRVPNPVNPLEDFTDKWKTREGQELRLEDNFKWWVEQLKNDMRFIFSSPNLAIISERLDQKMSVSLSSTSMKSLGAVFATSALIGTPAVATPYIIEGTPAKPWQAQ